ncbi:RILP-like protein 1 [Acipenser ruthenus]|uniref:RILP-like protein 1 n=1 Tax=Acipenser ruthenus TaxID=7906 RepID=A0A444USR8_ACIRT|nr:RILP-like protein 1 [Acipenser ruthenus]
MFFHVNRRKLIGMHWYQIKAVLYPGNTLEVTDPSRGMSERERQVMKKLKEVVDKQRDEIRAKDRELTLKNEDIEALQQQQNRLMKINHDLRHKITVVEAQGKALIEQKVELEAFLQTHEQEMSKLRTEIGKLREKLQGEPSHNGEEPKAESIIEEESASEKMASELKDPNRPRFTLQELRDVLHERNELKAKVFLLQEELAYYKRFSFFSRDKKRNLQRNVRFEDTFSAWADKEDAYTEQGQEALQHL